MFLTFKSNLWGLDFQFFEKERHKQRRYRNREEIFHELPSPLFQKRKGQERKAPEYDAHANDAYQSSKHTVFYAFRVLETDKFIFQRQTDSRRDRTCAKLYHALGREEERKQDRQQGEPGKDVVFLAFEFLIDELPNDGEKDTEGSAGEDVGGPVHAEIQSGEHDADGEDGEKNPRPELFIAECAGEEESCAHLRVTAWKGFVRGEFGSGDERIVDIQTMNVAVYVRTGSADGGFDTAVDGHGREGDKHQSFAQFFLVNPVDKTNEDDEKECFAEKREQNGEESAKTAP